MTAVSVSPDCNHCHLKMPGTIKIGSIDSTRFLMYCRTTSLPCPPCKRCNSCLLYMLYIYQDEPVLYGQITHIAGGVLNPDRSMTLILVANQFKVFENIALPKNLKRESKTSNSLNTCFKYFLKKIKKTTLSPPPFLETNTARKKNYRSIPGKKSVFSTMSHDEVRIKAAKASAALTLLLIFHCVLWNFWRNVNTYWVQVRQLFRFLRLDHNLWSLALIAEVTFSSGLDVPLWMFFSS